MNDSEEYIEAYFKNKLNNTDKVQFEERCVNDPVFANEVALYIIASEAVRQKLLAQKRSQWEAERNESGQSTLSRLKPRLIPRWLPYAAAACLIITAALYFAYDTKAPQDLAHEYINKNYSTLYQNMTSSSDSLQQGIAAFNNKEYAKALVIFQNLYQSDPHNVNAKKYMGVVYLVTKDYDKALQHFEELANTPNLFRNPGLFLQAVTLLERNETGDKQAAKQLLEQVVKNQTDGSREAEKWLKQW